MVQLAATAAPAVVAIALTIFIRRFLGARRGLADYGLAVDRPSPWRRDRQDLLPDARWNQLWRNHLLVEAVRRHPQHQYDSGRLAVLHHPQDPAIGKALDGYRDCLRDDSSLLVWPLDEVIGAWSSAPGLAEGHNALLQSFAMRYLELSRSEAAWQSLTR